MMRRLAPYAVAIAGVVAVTAVIGLAYRRKAAMLPATAGPLPNVAPNHNTMRK